MVVAVWVQNEGQQVTAPQDRMDLREMFRPEQVKDYGLCLHRFNWRRHCPTSGKAAQAWLLYQSFVFSYQSNHTSMLRTLAIEILLYGTGRSL